MAQWEQMEKWIPYLDNQTLNLLYPPNSFPIDVRYYLALWIEEQRWEDFDMDNVGQEQQALSLLEGIIALLQKQAQTNQDLVKRMRLQEITRIMNLFHSQPVQLMVIIRDSLKKERVLLSRVPFQEPPIPNLPTSQAQEQLPPPPASNTWDVDQLVLKVLKIQESRQKIHQLQEELNWEKQNYETMQGSIQQNQTNGLDPQQSEVIKLQNNIQKKEFMKRDLSKSCVKLLQEAVCNLGKCQERLIDRIKTWRWEQYQATIGHPFDDNLCPLQTWCEQLLGVNGKLRQEVLLVGGPIPELQAALAQLLQSLIQSCLMVDKQPPQVIKTQSKFSTTVRYLLGEKVVQGKPVLLKAQIITESQARSLGQLGSMPSENVGEVINNTAILEHNTSSKSTCVTFRNMSIKKIKRADRKGSESVTEEKFALLFSTEISITGYDTSFKIWIISLPLVVIVHGSQDNNALATIIWDCAFCAPDRVPFEVPERVPWMKMNVTLNSKFMSEVQTNRCLDGFNQQFLAQKIFDKPDISGDYSNMPVSWLQFAKEMLPGRPFTFWQWFDGVMELSKKHLKSYWSDGLIFGFIGKQHLHVILKDRPNGTFLLRFSDSEIGGITIAYVSASENGGQKIQNIQPFTKRDLDIRCLGDRIRDIDFITHVYPDLPKNDVFKKYYTVNALPPSGGYIGVSIQTKVVVETTSPIVSSMACNDTPQDSIPPHFMTQGNGSLGMSPIYQQPQFPLATSPGGMYPAPDPMSEGFPSNSLFLDTVGNMSQAQDMELDNFLDTFQNQEGLGEDDCF